jgi:hypoxanthine-DNA glycosylase
VVLLRGLAPVDGPVARILILGSFPGERSLAAGEYYAHPQNRFWRTVGTALGESDAPDYPARTRTLRAHRIALWDVLAACERRGSLDSAIAPGTEVPNDFSALIRRQPELRRILLNGRKAADLFARFIVPDAFWPDLGLEVRVMPSTSPANARDIAGQLREWCAALGD